MEEKQFIPLPIKQAAYAGVLFFGPLIKRQLWGEFWVYDDYMKNFVASWCKLGTVNLWIGLGLSTVSILNIYLWAGLLDILVWVLWAGLLRSLVRSVWMISCGRALSISSLSLTKEERNQILYCFFPGISSVRWFHSLQMGRGIWRAKEAELWRFVLLMIGVIDPSGYLRWGALLLWGVRLVGLAFWVDLVGQEQKQVLHWLMQRWPEELLFLNKEAFIAMWRMPMRSWIWRMGILLLCLLMGVAWWMRWKIGVLLLWIVRFVMIVSKNQV